MGIVEVRKTTACVWVCTLCVSAGRGRGCSRVLTTFLIAANDLGGSSVRYVNGIAVAVGLVTDVSDT